jgi:CHASE3 domain sensor protein
MEHLGNEETSARVYSLTGDSQYLKTYHSLTDSVHYRLAN